MLSIRSLPALVALLGGLCLLAGTTAPTWAGESKTLKDKNVKWSLPDDGGWVFEAFSASAQENGYVIRAVGKEVSTSISLMVRPQDGLTAQDLLAEVATFNAGQLASVSRSGGFEGKVSGLSASCAYAYGKAKGGSEVHVSAYVLLKGGKFYVLVVQAYHGAHKDKFALIDEARRGLQLIKGAGPTEAPASAPPEGDEGGGVNGGGAQGDGSGLNPENWPENGPKWDAGAIVFPSQNLRWMLPEGTPFQVTGVIEDETAMGARLVVLTMKQGEGEDEAECEVTVAAIDRGAGFTPQVQVNDMNYQAGVSKLFHERRPGGVTLEEEYELGEITGSRFGLKGKTEEGAYVDITDTWVALRDRVYRFRTVTTGPRDGAQRFSKALDDLFGGIAFPESAEPVAGPLAGAVAFHVIPRGNYLTKSYVVKAPGMSVEKPKGFGKLTNLQGQNLQFAFETRTEDGQAYLYLDLAVFSNAALSQNGIKVEGLIETRAGNWDEQASGNVSLGKRGKGGKPAFIKAKWGKAKGTGYRFEAEYLGNPFVENGYVVRHKQNTYFIRLQYGGVDAEKRFKKTVKALQKKWKWLKK